MSLEVFLLSQFLKTDHKSKVNYEAEKSCNARGIVFIFLSLYRNVKVYTFWYSYSFNFPVYNQNFLVDQFHKSVTSYLTTRDVQKHDPKIAQFVVHELRAMQLHLHFLNGVSCRLCQQLFGRHIGIND